MAEPKKSTAKPKPAKAAGPKFSARFVNDDGAVARVQAVKTRDGYRAVTRKFPNGDGRDPVTKKGRPTELIKHAKFASFVDAEAKAQEYVKEVEAKGYKAQDSKRGPVELGFDAL